MPGRQNSESRREYWQPKLARNQQRDAAAQAALQEQGWQCIVIWECELKDASAALKAVRRFLGRAGAIWR